MQTKSVKKLVVMAMMSAISLGLFLLRFPIPGMPPNLKINIADLPAAIISFAYGPLPGLCVCLVRNLLSFFLPGIGENSGIVGELANFCVTAMYILPMGFIYRFWKNKKGAVIALIVATICMVITCIPINIFVMFPLYAPGMELSARFAMVMSMYVPFNLIKGFLNSLLTFILYKHISHLIKK